MKKAALGDLQTTFFLFSYLKQCRVEKGEKKLIKESVFPLNTDGFKL